MNQNPTIIWVAPLACVLFASMFSGCASSAANAANEARFATVQARLEESERNNGRLTVRMEELDDQVFLLQDRVEANRLALQRRGVMRGAFEQQVAQAPQAAPESYYDGNNYQAQPQPQSRRNVTRIPLYEPDPYAEQTREVDRREEIHTQTARTAEPELVITDKEYDAFVGGTPSRQTSSNTTTGGQKRQAQAPVTSERLSTTNGTPSVQELEQPTTQVEKTTRKDALGIYKDSLAAYRAGQYQEALTGFREFLDSKPRADYVDNALYWLGECEFGLGRFDESVGYFKRVMSEQPDGNKVPDSLLKMSLAFERLGNPDQAKKALQQLTSQYPSSNAGQLGLQKLNEM
jgi:tol-pal system protein YbgF